MHELKKFLSYVLVETDTGTTASTGLSRNAKARTAKEDCHRPKPAKVIYPSTQTDRGIMVVLLTGQHSCGILTHRIMVVLLTGQHSCGILTHRTWAYVFSCRESHVREKQVFKMMFFEKDGSAKGWPWQSVARFLRVVDQCAPSARPRGRLGELLL